jgi:hypothetical protein
LTGKLPDKIGATLGALREAGDELIAALTKLTLAQGAEIPQLVPGNGNKIAGAPSRPLRSIFAW